MFARQRPARRRCDEGCGCVCDTIADVAKEGKPVSELRRKLRRIADEMAELPGLRWLAEPRYRNRFRRHRMGNAYWGVYPTFAAARAAIPTELHAGYDTDAGAVLYASRLSRLEASDYAPLFWLSRLLQQGQRRVFDLGGHVGVSYYAFQQHLDYSDDLRWLVHDVPTVMQRGRMLASERGVAGQLQFVDASAADGCDVLMAKGVLQYLEYTLAEFLQRLQEPPRHLIINLTPMHATEAFFTLQNIGVAVCPYRVSALPQFIAELAALGYRVGQQWDHPERSVRIPFHADRRVDRFHGFCLRRD